MEYILKFLFDFFSTNFYSSTFWQSWLLFLNKKTRWKLKHFKVVIIYFLVSTRKFVFLFFLLKFVPQNLRPIIYLKLRLKSFLLTFGKFLSFCHFFWLYIETFDIHLLHTHWLMLLMFAYKKLYIYDYMRLHIFDCNLCEILHRNSYVI